MRLFPSKTDVNQDTFVTEILHLLTETFVQQRKSPRHPAEINGSSLLKDLQDWESFLQEKAWDFQAVPCCRPTIDVGRADNASSFSCTCEPGVTLTKIVPVSGNKRGFRQQHWGPVLSPLPGQRAANWCCWLAANAPPSIRAGAATHGSAEGTALALFTQQHQKTIFDLAKQS